jgi:hypothetical protein
MLQGPNGPLSSIVLWFKKPAVVTHTKYGTIMRLESLEMRHNPKMSSNTEAHRT